jgi:hypothetical protein
MQILGDQFLDKKNDRLFRQSLAVIFKKALPLG